MTAEEKAKAYDEALKKIRPLYEQAKKDDNPIWSTYEYLIPQLRESEDERIRRTLVEYFGPKVQLDFVRGVPIQKIRDWLEKQKEPKDPFDDEQFSRGYEAGKHDALRGQVDAFVTEYNKGFDAGRLEGLTAGYNKAVKEIEQKEQKPVDYEAELKKCKDNPLYFYDKYVSIKQKPAEWSKEDEMYLSQAIETLEHENYSILADKLKSLRPCPSWKPSEEQMNGLAHAINLDVYDAKRYGLDSLYSDLKKLM